MPGGVQLLYSGAAQIARHLCTDGEFSAASRYLSEDGRLMAPLSEWSAGRETVLSGGLSQEQLASFLEGNDPVSGESHGPLRHRRGEGGEVEARAGKLTTIDATITAEKGDSILAAVDGEYRWVMRRVMDDMRAAMLADFSRRAVTRIGGRGAQIEHGDVAIQAAHVEHEASRAGDPHLHQHCLISVRVRDRQGKWRGLWTRPALPDLIAAREAAYAVYMTHPARLAWLAEHGYTTTAEGRIAQLETVAPVFSQRHRQIAGNRGHYEETWRAQHPGETPSEHLRATWDAIGWRDGRPDKQTYLDLTERTRERLTALGYDAILPGAGRGIEHSAPGTWEDVDVEQVAAAALADLEGQGSAWSFGQVRAAAGRATRAAGVAAHVASSPEQAAEMVDRVDTAMAASMHSVLDGDRLPTRATKHLASERVEREHDQLEDAFRRLAGDGPVFAEGHQRPVTAGLNAGQADAAALISGASRLGVIVGRAGSGKTTMLRSAREQLDTDGRRMLGTAPTLRAAAEMSEAVGMPADSVHRLLVEHGWRQGDDGSWRQLAVGEVEVMPDGAERAWTGPREPYAAPAGSVLVVDEAGMLAVPEAAALALLAVTNDWHLRLVGDSRQLAQVGRGGIMETANSWAGDGQTVTLDEVVRHVRPVARDDGRTEWVVDTDYPDLLDRLLAATTDEERRAVAEELFDRGERGETHGAVVTVPTPGAAEVMVARARAEDEGLVVVAATNEEARAVHDAERVITVGLDRATVTGMEGQPIGAGDTVATRHNERQLGVRNRDLWTVRELHDDGSVTVASRDQYERTRHLPPEYVRQHVQGAGAGTGHGWQGHTGDHALVLLSERTDRRGLYVGLSRGRQSNRLVVPAADREQAVERIAAALGRDSADPGLPVARRRAHDDSVPTTAAAPSPAEAEIRHQNGWRTEDELRRADRRLAQLRTRLASQRRTYQRGQEGHDRRIADLRAQVVAARGAASRAREAAAEQTALAGRYDSDGGSEWVPDIERRLTAQTLAARTVEAGSGFLGRRRDQVTAAHAAYSEQRQVTGIDVSGRLTANDIGRLATDIARRRAAEAAAEASAAAVRCAQAAADHDQQADDSASELAQTETARSERADQLRRDGDRLDRLSRDVAATRAWRAAIAPGERDRLDAAAEAARPRHAWPGSRRRPQGSAEQRTYEVEVGQDAPGVELGSVEL